MWEWLCSGQCAATVSTFELAWHCLTWEPPVSPPIGRGMVLTCVVTEDRWKHNIGEIREQFVRSLTQNGALDLFDGSWQSVIRAAHTIQEIYTIFSKYLPHLLHSEFHSCQSSWLICSGVNSTNCNCKYFNIFEPLDEQCPLEAKSSLLIPIT